MINETITTHDERCVHPFRRVSWTAIFVGALVAVGIGFLLNLFGVAISLSAIHLNNDGGAALAWGGFIGVLIGIIVAMLVAGYVAGYLGRIHCPQRNWGILYGFATWTVALLISAFVATSLTQYVATYASRVATSVVIAQTNAPTDVVVEAPASETVIAEQSGGQVVANSGHMAVGVFILFIFFFVGAVSACIGGCWGMTCKRVE